MSEIPTTEIDASSRKPPAGFRRMFRPGQMTLGIFFPIEAYPGSMPTMADQIERARRAEALGFDALWFRDVPLLDPGFGDAAQIFDPFVYMAWIGAHTRSIALATGSIVLPIRHPLHTAKQAASVDNLTDGRLVLGVASGDRAVEYPAFGQDLSQRGEMFRDSLDVLRRALHERFPSIDSAFGRLHGADMIPKPTTGFLPALVTGRCKQDFDWIAREADGWIMYPQAVPGQADVVHAWREAVQQQAPGVHKPFAQSLYIDLAEDPGAPPTPIHLGFRAGRRVLIDHLRGLRDAGVEHVALNVKFAQRPVDEILEELGTEVLPFFAPANSDA